MDLHVRSAPPSAAERDAVDAVLGPATSSWEGGARRPLDGHAAFGGRARAVERRSLLLPALHSLQERVGWVSTAALDYLCTRLDVAPADAYGVASAYALLSLEPSPRLVVHVCDDVACLARSGAAPGARGEGDPGGHDGAGDGTGVAWRPSPCLGQCEQGSAALVQRAGPDAGRWTLAPFTEAQRSLLERGDVEGALAGAASAAPERQAPQLEGDRSALRLLRRVGLVDPASLDAYRAAGGYEALRRALELGPLGVLREIADARLLGRGGAAFPTAAKWEAVARHPRRPHYVVANADESEPGTFKDRILLEQDPFALVEALTVAGVVTGAERGFVYVRGEYPLAERRVAEAAAAARARGLLGDDVMGSGLRFDLEVRRGAGAYVAGEETALLNSIEGRRPEPRNKPPFPADRGLFGRPTVVNNVETLLCVLEVLRFGAAAFAAVGTPGSTGTRLFCVSGCVARPGVYEVPLGTSLRSLLALAGGVREGRALQAVLLGGAAGVMLGPGDLDLPLSFEGARAAGATLGSGVVVVLDETVDVTAVLARIARFFRDESCGQCVPCRVGTVRQEEALARLVARGGALSPEDAELLADLHAVMRDASICGLGQTAGSALESALQRGLFAREGA